MDKKTEGIVKREILKYKWKKWLAKRPWELELEKKRDELAAIRNGIFEAIQNDLQSYVLKILKNWRKNESEQQVLSHMWGGFYFALEKYRDFNVPIPYYFFSFIRYYLLDYYGRQSNVLLPIEELHDILSVEPTVDNILFRKLMIICQYRSNIPEKYHVIFDDAFQSLYPAPKWQQRTPEGKKAGGYSQPVYNAVKSILMATLRFMEI